VRVILWVVGGGFYQHVCAEFDPVNNGFVLENYDSRQIVGGRKVNVINSHQILQGWANFSRGGTGEIEVTGVWIYPYLYPLEEDWKPFPLYWCLINYQSFMMTPQGLVIPADCNIEIQSARFPKISGTYRFLEDFNPFDGALAPQFRLNAAPQAGVILRRVVNTGTTCRGSANLNLPSSELIKKVFEEY